MAICSEPVENPFAKGFGGKESVKGNRQGFLSRAIRPLFETFCGVSKSEVGCRENPAGLFRQPDSILPIMAICCFFIVRNPFVRRSMQKIVVGLSLFFIPFHADKKGKYCPF